MSQNRSFSRFRLALACAVSAATPAAHAVNVNPHGDGQVLIYPYYTANAGNNTLLSLINDSAQSKALKLRFHEGVNGRVVFSANVYLDAGDMWTAGVFQAPDGSAALVTDDPSCTVPDLRNDTNLPALADGRRYVRFSSAEYTGARADGGPTTTARSREGHIEVIEMGKLSGASADAARMLYGETEQPRDCARLVAAWTPGGYWATNAGTDLAAPGGGLVGNATIVNVARGSVFGIAATALDGFSVRTQHTSPGDAHPNLADAVTNENTGAASAFVSYGTRTVRADYPLARAIDAVSAVLATPYNQGETIAASDGSARTEWVLAAPTKRFYVDPTLQNAVLGQAPFGQRFGEPVAGRACRIITQGYTPVAYSRNGQSLVGFPEPPPTPMLCYDTTVVTFGGDAPTPVLGSSNSNSEGAFDAGYLKLLWRNARTQPAIGGEAFAGLPVLGVQITNWFNGNVVPGVLANYGLALPLRTTSECVKDNGDC